MQQLDVAPQMVFYDYNQSKNTYIEILDYRL